MVEVTVKMKSEDGSRKYSKKFLVYEQIVLNNSEIDDMQSFIDATLEEWKDDRPDDVQISIKMTV